MSDQAPDDDRPRATNADVAREAFIHSLASNLAFLGLVLAVNVAVAKRDTIILAWRRATARRRHGGIQARIDREVAAFRADLDEITHAAGGLTDEP